MTTNHFKIVIPSFNNEEWLKACIKSVKRQNYQNYQCIIIDDCSTDNSCSIIDEEIEGHPNFVFVRNKEKKLALRNIYEAIELSNPSPEDIVITLDGDDFLYGTGVLSRVNEIYNENDCWVTYGSYIEYPSSRRGKFSSKIPDSVIDNNSFRESAWMSSHMRTFKIKLWNKIEKQDLLEPDGRFCDGAWDMVFMFPMLEMSGHRSHFIEDILYIYNRKNPLNEDKVNHSKIINSENRIRKMKKYKRIEL
jgi:glycosyltransferase involved in cell wall biosynthesis